MDKKGLAIAIAIVVIILGVLAFFLLKAHNPGMTTTSTANSIFENPANYVDAGNVTARFEHYTSVSRHTAKTDILNSPLFFNGYEVIVVGLYAEKELYGEKLGVLTDSVGTLLILANKGSLFKEGTIYEVTGIVKVVKYEGKDIPVIWVESATEYVSPQPQQNLSS